MENAGSESDVLRSMVVEAVEKCTDPSLLDLIYKLLVLST